MRQLRMLGAAMVAILSISIVASSVAQALEFQALPEKVKFTFKSKAGENTKLETLVGKKIECKSVEGSGEFTSERLGSATFKFKECKEPTLNITCTGLGDTSGNITATGEFHIRHLLKTPEGVEPEPEVNIAILVSTAHFSCSIALFVVSGCVASMDMLTKENGELIIHKLLATIFVNFLQEKGDQKPTSIDTDDSLHMESCILLTKEGGGANESSGQLGSGTIEKFENAAKEKVTILVDLLGVY